jgi:hypothetical protein
MKRLSIAIGLFLCLTVALVALNQNQASAASDAVVAAATTGTPAAQGDFFVPDAETYGKKCSFNSDCRYGKCKKSRCGGCSFNSDCKGWGKCKKGWCGGCSFNSDCKGFGGCKSGRCKKSPY